jgi:hypothetical protein
VKAVGGPRCLSRWGVPVPVGLIGIGVFELAGVAPGIPAAGAPRAGVDPQLVLSESIAITHAQRRDVAGSGVQKDRIGTGVVAQAGRVAPESAPTRSGEVPGGPAPGQPPPITTAPLRMTGVGDGTPSEARPVIATGPLTMTGVAGVGSAETPVIATDELTMTGVGP